MAKVKIKKILNIIISNISIFVHYLFEVIEYSKKQAHNYKGIISRLFPI